ncbi:MAG: hypothetical protein KatS3mg006_1186 [Pyrinomonadaceae bacterium]|jgi:small subunit ribosomal protein S17|nr:MAG: hypothetical protein KatS3mg006_1186 [Pyrinomonadaceae bacterium]
MEEVKEKNGEALEENLEGAEISRPVETSAEEVPAMQEVAADAKPEENKQDSTSGSEGAKKIKRRRTEKIGVVVSDKMTKTVVVMVERLVKHPKYRKYVRRRKKFMAHDELGAKIGDKVKIVETRPLSARKRWRVVEILQRVEG